MPAQIVPSNDIDLMVSLLMEADEGEQRIRQTVADRQNTAYLIEVDGATIGAALMRWHPDESELIYIAVKEAHQGQGYGQAAIGELIEMARTQGVKAVIVGTANSGLANIIFYQKCGFRIDSVRKDYFNYFTKPVYEHGVEIRDMLMLRYDLNA